MICRIWIFNQDNSFIDSFLDGMAIAHDEAKKSPEWFHWKFEQSPYGKVIMACAFDKDKVAGCVAYGLGLIEYNSSRYKCALSYETFVHPDYQGQGLFKKLIALAEDEAKKQGVVFLYNFPNTNSLPGFKHMGWTCRNDIQQYKLRLIRPAHAVFHLNDLRKEFAPQPSNIKDIVSIPLDNVQEEEARRGVITPIWTKDYLVWRFFTFPNRRYYMVNNNDLFAIAMVGNRGRLTEVHVLYVLPRRGRRQKGRYIDSLVHSISKTLKPDIISYRSTSVDTFFSYSKGFIKVPTHSNFCYKILSDDFQLGDFKMVLPSINAHTY